MFTSIAAEVARLSRRGLCLAVALALSLTCIALALVASTTPMSDMRETTATAVATVAPGASAGVLTGSLNEAADGGVLPGAAAPLASVAPAPMSSMCDSVCVTGLSRLCGVVAALTVTTLLALLLASRRDTLLGLLARARPRARQRRRRRTTRWRVISPISLCVLRV